MEELAREALDQLFVDEDKAQDFFIQSRWPNGIACPSCGSMAISNRATKNQPFRCRDCALNFSPKTLTVMHSSKLPLRKWAKAFYLLSKHPKGVSSITLSWELGISQKSAWHLAHRIREAWKEFPPLFSGPVEVDETYLGGREYNKHANKKNKAGRGHSGKLMVVGLKDRETNKVYAEKVEEVDRYAPQNLILRHVEIGSWVYTDDALFYKGMDFVQHDSVVHSRKQYVKGEVHTNGIESFWALLRRSIYGCYHWISRKHTNRYLVEVSGRHNYRDLTITEKLSKLIKGSHGKRLTYLTLTSK